MKPKVFHGVLATAVPKKVGEFKDLIDLGRIRSSQYTVICFSGMRGSSTSIVGSSLIVKVIEKYRKGTEPIIVVAHDFTQEARTIMQEENVIPFFKSDFGWTDERWAHIRDNY